MLFTGLGHGKVLPWGGIPVADEAIGQQAVEDADEQQAVEDADHEATDDDRRTGYYIAGHDWPAISNSISLAKIYKALNQINDDTVGAALKDVAEPPESASAA